MGDSNSNADAKHALTKDEKQRLSKTRADESDVKSAAKKIISKHRNAIKELANR